MLMCAKGCQGKLPDAIDGTIGDRYHTLAEVRQQTYLASNSKFKLIHAPRRGRFMLESLDLYK
jgi:hypothetical protein